MSLILGTLLSGGVLSAIPEKESSKKLRLSLTEAAYTGKPEAIRKLARYYMQQDEHVLAAKWLEEGVKKEDVESMWMLSELIMSGWLGQRDEKKAIALYYDLLDFSQYKANVNLGDIYANEASRHYDIKKAVLYYTDGAKFGYEEAMFKLGKFYMSGFEGRPDYPQAIKWLSQAIEKNNKNSKAMHLIGMAYQYGMSDKEDVKKAFEYYRQASDLGHQESSYVLAEAYYEGKGVDQDKKLAKEYYQMAARQGHGPSENRLKNRSF